MEDLFATLLPVLASSAGPPLGALLVTVCLRLWMLPVVRTRVFGWVRALPRWAQPVAPVALACAVAAGEQYLSGSRGEALLLGALRAGGEIGAMSIGLWHVGKRVLPPLVAAAKRLPPAAGLLLVLLGSLVSLMSGCSGVQYPPDSAQRAIGAAKVALTATDAALQQAIERDPDSPKWSGLAAKVAATRDAVNRTGATVRDVCAALPTIETVAQLTECADCQTVARLARQLGGC